MKTFLCGKSKVDGVLLLSWSVYLFVWMDDSQIKETWWFKGFCLKFPDIDNTSFQAIGIPDRNWDLEQMPTSNFLGKLNPITTITAVV